ncbi:MAG: hypothetical protein NZM09_06885 [Ignavibacterium sp.]|nr:hypothetical protein [Ignavibacterium sp.]MDW8375405.1 hypothetical protein [Ignavibacteriales bacterium]
MSQESIFYCIIDCPFDKNKFLMNNELFVSDNDLIFLKNSLIENLIENIIKSKKGEEKIELFFLLKGNLTYNELIEKYSNSINFNFFDNEEKLIEALIKFTHYIIFYSNSIGISSKDIGDSISLTYSENNSLVISISDIGDNCYFAFNKFDERLIDLILNCNINYDEFLLKLEAEKFFIHTIKKHFRVNSFADLKILYKNLSLKESAEYCSQNMLEKFTNLFIEYRDHIK